MAAPSLRMNNASRSPEKKIDYRALARWHERNKLMEIEQEIQKKVEKSIIVRTEVLTSSILRRIAEGQYDEAAGDLEAYCRNRPGFPLFFSKAEGTLKYCQKLIRAIQYKRHQAVGAVNSKAKQQHFQDQVLAHFEDLKAHLRRLEKLEREFKAEDIRSTVWVLKAASLSLFALVALVTFSELYYGLGNEIISTVEETMDMSLEYAFGTFGL